MVDAVQFEETVGHINLEQYCQLWFTYF